MSDTATPGSLDTFLLDGDAPRLGSPAAVPPPPPQAAAEPAQAIEGDGAAPVVAATPSLPTPSLPAPSLPAPSLTTPASTVPIASGDGVDAPTEAGASGEQRHPMAHLMPAKSQASESSAWAAELRAKKKAKARRNKIIASVVVVAVCALVGPPLGAWLVNAINESGSTKPDEPATTVPATSAPAAVASTAPAASAAPTTAGGLAGLPGQAEAAVAGVNAASPTAPPTTVAP